MHEDNFNIRVWGIWYSMNKIDFQFENSNKKSDMVRYIRSCCLFYTGFRNKISWYTDVNYITSAIFIPVVTLYDLNAFS